MTPSVFALDVATTTGWAWHRPGMPRPYFDAIRLPGKPLSVGQPMSAMWALLENSYRASEAEGYPITHFFYEKPFIGKNVNASTSKRLMGLGGVVEMFAFEKKAHCYEVDISEARKHFIGRGSGFKKYPNSDRYMPGEDPKELAIKKCATYGWHTNVHDAAEALGVLDYSLTMIPDYPRPWRDYAMFGGALR